jgi:hypothetical protein
MNKSITPENNKGQRHGYWEYYFKGDLTYKCFYHNSKEIGYEETYDYEYDGEIFKKTYHI